MKKLLRSSVMMVLTAGFAVASSAGQDAPMIRAGGIDFGFAYTAKVAKISNLSNSNFVMNGAEADAGFRLPGITRMGIAVEASGEHANNVAPGVSLDQFQLVAGPRYTLWRGGEAGSSIYIQGMGGYVHGFNSMFPRGQQLRSAATGFAFLTGGGWNWPASRHFGVRVAEVDYELTRLANNAETFQADFRASSGLNFHF